MKEVMPRDASGNKRQGYYNGRKKVFCILIGQDGGNWFITR
jgi:hypothetical protein